MTRRATPMIDTKVDVRADAKAPGRPRGIATMFRSSLRPLLLLAVGLALCFWGYNATEAAASGAAEAVKPGPTGVAMLLLTGGALVVAAGVVELSRSQR